MAMDFISGPTNTTAATTGSATIPRSPDSDTDTPPHLPPSKRAHHANGTNSSSGNNHVHVSYKECLKNHAASIGGHALDGCCEFMPGPTSNHVDPTSLTCAACGCHRNFHRRDPDDPTPIHHLIPPSAVARKPHSPPSASQLLLSLSGHTHSPSAPSDHEIAHNPTAVSGGGAVVGFYNNGSGGGGGGQNGNFSQTNNNGNSSSNKKRFRTKFSQEQKEKMYEFSEKIGWKLKKGEERLVEDFCKEVGVDRSVFKVWMHNNKHSSSSSTTITPFSSSQKPEKLADSIPRHEVGHLNNHHSSSSNNNSGSVAMNCGGVLASGIDFNFANGGGQEARAQ